MRTVLALSLFVGSLFAADISGSWEAQVETSAGSGAPSFVFKQAGEKLTGSYSGALGQAELTGTVKGDAIEFRFDVSPQGDKVKVIYQERHQYGGFLGRREPGGRHLDSDQTLELGRPADNAAGYAIPGGDHHDEQDAHRREGGGAANNHVVNATSWSGNQLQHHRDGDGEGQRHADHQQRRAE